MIDLDNNILVKSKISPSLRFPEFQANWQSYQLKKMIDFQSGYAFKSSKMKKKGDLQIIKMSNVYQNKLELTRSQAFWDEMEDGLEKFLLNKGDSILTLTGTVGKQDYGYSVLISKNNKYLLNQRLLRLRGIENQSYGEFINSLIKTDRFLHKFFSEGKGGTGNQSNVGVGDIKEIKLYFPSFEEQQKIASFLSAVDKRIDLLEQKKAKLLEYKKGVMQQIFSREIRFKPRLKDLDLPPGTFADLAADFSDWKKKKLGEVFELKKGKQLNRIELEDSGEFPSISGGIEPSGYTDRWNTEENTIIISEGGNSCGYVNFIETKFWCGGHCYSLTPKINSYNKSFLYQALKFKQREIMRLRVGSGLPNIQKKDLIKFKIEIPEIVEQNKIAAFLTSIDNKIEIVEQQIEGSNQFKKGLLQQMFV